MKQVAIKATNEVKKAIEYGDSNYGITFGEKTNINQFIQRNYNNFSQKINNSGIVESKVTPNKRSKNNDVRASDCCQSALGGQLQRKEIIEEMNNQHHFHCYCCQCLSSSSSFAAQQRAEHDSICNEEIGESKQHSVSFCNNYISGGDGNEDADGDENWDANGNRDLDGDGGGNKKTIFIANHLKNSSHFMAVNSYHYNSDYQPDIEKMPEEYQCPFAPSKSKETIINCSKLCNNNNNKYMLHCIYPNYCCCSSNIIHNNNNPLKQIHRPVSKNFAEIHDAWVSIVDNFNTDVNEFPRRRKRIIKQKNKNNFKAIILKEENDYDDNNDQQQQQQQGQQLDKVVEQHSTITKQVKKQSNLQSFPATDSFYFDENFEFAFSNKKNNVERISNDNNNKSNCSIKSDILNNPRQLREFISKSELLKRMVVYLQLAGIAPNDKNDNCQQQQQYSYFPEKLIKYKNAIKLGDHFDRQLPPECEELSDLINQSFVQTVRIKLIQTCDEELEQQIQALKIKQFTQDFAHLKALRTQKQELDCVLEVLNRSKEQCTKINEFWVALINRCPHLSIQLRNMNQKLVYVNDDDDVKKAEIITIEIYKRISSLISIQFPPNQTWYHPNLWQDDDDDDKKKKKIGDLKNETDIEVGCCCFFCKEHGDQI